MEPQVTLESAVDKYFLAKKSFLTTETMKILLTAEDEALKLECLKLLNEIRG